MKRVREKCHTLHVIKNAKPKLRRAIISEGSKELINSINECVLNVLVGNISLSTCLQHKLKKYKLALRRLADKRVGHSANKRLLIQKGGFLLPPLTSILPIVASVFSRSQSTWREKHIMLRKVVLDSYKLPPDVGGEPATITLNRNRRRHGQYKQQTHVEIYRRLNKRKRKTAGKWKKRNGATLLPVHEYSKWLEMRRRDRNDIVRKRILIRTIANLLLDIMQVPKCLSTLLQRHKLLL